MIPGDLLRDFSGKVQDVLATPTSPLLPAQAGQGRAELLDWVPGKASTWRADDERIRMEFRPVGSVPPERAARFARIDLTHMVKVARSLGVPVLLVTYPYKEFDYANLPALAVARELDVEIVETIDDLARARADGHSLDDLVVMAAGPHPRALLYRYIVESMIPRVLAIGPHDEGATGQGRSGSTTP